MKIIIIFAVTAAIVVNCLFRNKEMQALKSIVVAIHKQQMQQQKQQCHQQQQQQILLLLVIIWCDFQDHN